MTGATGKSSSSISSAEGDGAHPRIARNALARFRDASSKLTSALGSINHQVQRDMYSDVNYRKWLTRQARRGTMTSEEVQEELDMASSAWGIGKDEADKAQYDWLTDLMDTVERDSSLKGEEI